MRLREGVEGLPPEVCEVEVGDLAILPAGVVRLPAPASPPLGRSKLPEGIQGTEYDPRFLKVVDGSGIHGP